MKHRQANSAVKWLLLIGLALTMAMALNSCEPIDGCGTVVGGRIYKDNYLLKVEFDSGKTQEVNVDSHTWISYSNGDIICF
jgi:hypothetical protein